MPRRRRRCATIAEAAARIEALEDQADALTEQINAQAGLQASMVTALEALNTRLRVLEAAQPFTLAR